MYEGIYDGQGRYVNSPCTVIINVTKEVKSRKKLSYLCRRDQKKTETVRRSLRVEVLRLQ